MSEDLPNRETSDLCTSTLKINWGKKKEEAMRTSRSEKEELFLNVVTEAGPRQTAAGASLCSATESLINIFGARLQNQFCTNTIEVSAALLRGLLRETKALLKQTSLVLSSSPSIFLPVQGFLLV